MTDESDDTEPTRDEAARNDAGVTPEPTGTDEPAPPKRGSVRYQDENTTPREPTLAEKRAMRKAEQDQVELERARAEATAEAERKAQLRRRVMIGGGVVVGLAATVAIWYAAAPDTVTASCVDDGDTLSSDQNICDESYVTSRGGHYDSSTGIFFLPYGGGYRQYHYYYGGSVDPRTQHVSGGTIAAPSGNTTVKSRTGSTIQRGGFGVKSSSGGSGGGGKAGSSGGSSGGGKSGGS